MPTPVLAGLSCPSSAPVSTLWSVQWEEVRRGTDGDKNRRQMPLGLVWGWWKQGVGTDVVEEDEGWGVGWELRKGKGRRQARLAQGRTQCHRGGGGGDAGGGGPRNFYHPPRGSPAVLPQPTEGPHCSSNMICNFRQTFEVPDICIMWACLLATGNSCLAFPRLNCNYTRVLARGRGGVPGRNTASWQFQAHFAFIHFLPLSKEAKGHRLGRPGTTLWPPWQVASPPPQVCLLA